MSQNWTPRLELFSLFGWLSYVYIYIYNTYNILYIIYIYIYNIMRSDAIDIRRRCGQMSQTETYGISWMEFVLMLQLPKSLVMKKTTARRRSRSQRSLMAATPWWALRRTCRQMTRSCSSTRSTTSDIWEGKGFLGFRALKWAAGFFSGCRGTARGSVEGKTPFNTGTEKCNKFFLCRLA